jgi:UDP-N-acetylmuramoylalanine--D-glutamate ligase
MKALIHPEQLRGHTVVVAGAGRSGLAAADLAQALGARVRVLEKNPDFDETALAGCKVSSEQLVLGEHKKEHFQGADMVIISPGIPVRSLENLVPDTSMIFSELEFASWFTHEPIIAVTGTNGKTTTTMLIAHALEKMGKKVFAGGNLGVPLARYVLGPDECDILVLEISSFQLEGCSGFHPRVGVFLNFSANHLDHHSSSEEYFRAKTRLFSRQTEDDLAVIALELKGEMENSGILKSGRIYFTASNKFSCPVLSGKHNRANMEAAFLACRYFGMDEALFSRALNDFAAPAHRQEVFLKYDGKTFVNDSKATTVAAVSAALEAFEKPVRLFAGGVYKGGDFSELIPLIRSKAAKVYLFGAGRKIFEKAWQGQVTLEYSPTLKQAVDKAISESAPGDTLLLSPGTSSFDLFRDYQERGSAFKSLVRKKLGLPDC